MENLKDILIDMADPEEEGEILQQAMQEVAVKAAKEAAKLIKGVKGDKGDKGDVPTKEEIVSLIKPLIPKPVKGDKGDSIRGYRGEKGDSIKGDKGDKGDAGKSVKLDEVVEKVLPDVLKRFPQGGGTLNRQIFINSADPLTRYTDLNLKAGSNVTITYQNNDVTKKVDVTIAATGGGGGAGITRSITSIATDTLAGNSTTTDYVYLASGTLNLTLPSTVGNSNLYTVKNIGAGTVTITPQAGELIDGQSNLQLPVQFTSVDLISNNSGNWDIT